MSVHGIYGGMCLIPIGEGRWTNGEKYMCVCVSLCDRLVICCAINWASIGINCRLINFEEGNVFALTIARGRGVYELFSRYVGVVIPLLNDVYIVI